jgi:pyruvate formate lyase activating enzyme
VYLCLSQGAITAGEAVKALDGSGELQKAVIDRKKCVACLKCTEACITKALYPTGRYIPLTRYLSVFKKTGASLKTAAGNYIRRRSDVSI